MSQLKVRKIKTDVFVIGSGGSGLRAAIEAAKSGLKVAVASKGLFRKSGSTVMSSGSLSAGYGHTDERDSPWVHFVDTVRGGDYLNDQDLVYVMTEDILSLAPELEAWGYMYRNRLDEWKFPPRAINDSRRVPQLPDSLRSKMGGLSGHRLPRMLRAGDWGGMFLVKILDRVARDIGIVPIEECNVIQLIVGSEGRIAGAAALLWATGELLIVECKSVVLASGGLGQLYKYTTNGARNTGDGYLLALDAGAELIDCEQVQFHPTGLVYPITRRGTMLTEGLRARGSRLLNCNGERFMEKYSPEWLEEDTRDVVARSIYNEVREGRGGPNGGCDLDCSHIPPEKRSYFTESFDKVKVLLGKNLWKDKVEIIPSVHYFMGGVRIDINGTTSVPGLYAGGEAAGGVQGGNRLGTNSIVDIIVYGARAGRSAAEFAKKTDWAEYAETAVDAAFHGVRNQIGKKPREHAIVLRKKLQELMWDKVGLFRTEQGLNEALQEVTSLRKDYPHLAGIPSANLTFCRDLLQNLELWSLIRVAECVTRSALFRTESRGAHFREDHPHIDHVNWLKHVVIGKGPGDDLSFRTAPVNTSYLDPVSDSAEAPSTSEIEHKHLGKSD